MGRGWVVVISVATALSSPGRTVRRGRAVWSSPGEDDVDEAWRRFRENATASEDVVRPREAFERRREVQFGVDVGRPRRRELDERSIVGVVRPETFAALGTVVGALFVASVVVYATGGIDDRRYAPPDVSIVDYFGAVVPGDTVPELPDGQGPIV